MLPERPSRRILARRARPAGVLHLVREGVEDADHDHAVGAGVEAAVDDRRHLVPTVEDTRVREDGDAARGQSRREIPLPPALESLERPLLAERLVLRAVELVDLLLELPAIELHYPGSMTYKSLNRPAVRAAAGVALILSLPLVAMRFTDEVVWSLGDFVLVGILLAIIGGYRAGREEGGSLAMAIGIAALGVACGVIGGRMTRPASYSSASYSSAARCARAEEPTRGFEPRTPSLRVKCSTSR